MPRPQPNDVQRIAVLGTGTIGASWAALFLARGKAVIAYDPDARAEERVRRFVRDAWPALRALANAPAVVPDRLGFVSEPEAAVAEAEFVQESGPERVDEKAELYRRLDGAVPRDTVIASSTSGLLMSELQRGRVGPERYVVGHPFNPPHLMPLVEVVGGEQTDPGAVDWAVEFYAALGKHPIRVRKEVPGHVANRLQAALWREAVHLVATGVASAEDVDAAVAYGPGLRWALMGPHLILHLGGGPGGMRHFLEHLGPAFESWWDDLGRPRLSPEVADAVVKSVDEEVGGRSFEELARQRDRLLVGVLETLAHARGNP